MGRLIDNLYDHEGYVAAVMADGSEGHDVYASAGHRAACTCGWRGPTTHDHPGEDLCGGDGRQGDELLTLWESTHIAELQWRTTVQDADRAVLDAESVRLRAIASARHHGASWAEIGAALGVSRQAAHERFAGAVERLSGVAAG